jgi:hypothetical protein
MSMVISHDIWEELAALIFRVVKEEKGCIEEMAALRVQGKIKLSNWCSEPVGDVVCGVGGVMSRTHQMKGSENDATGSRSQARKN